MLSVQTSKSHRIRELFFAQKFEPVLQGAVLRCGMSNIANYFFMLRWLDYSNGEL